MTLELDPDRGAFIFCCGAKGRGKSELCKTYFRRFPYYRVVIDSNSDIDPENSFSTPWHPGFELVRERKNGRPPRYRCELPEPDGRWPSLRYEVDFSHPDAPYLVDAIIEAVYTLGSPNESERPEWATHPVPACIWVDECGEFAPAGQVTPNMRQALHKGRHRKITLILAGPRPMGIDVLILSQADLVAMFDTPHELDRKRLAAELGISVAELASLLDNLDTHGYLVWDSWGRELSVMPPLELSGR